MPYYPVNLNISGKRCAIVGGGKIAERKTEDILEAGGQVHLISPLLTEKLCALAREGTVTCELRPYKSGDIKNFFLVICAADDSWVNRLAAAEAKQQGALVDVADDQEISDFTVPAKIRRGNLVITVSTSGKSPALARILKEDIALRYGEEYGLFLDIISQIRQEVKELLPESKERESFWRKNFDLSILALLREGKIKEAKNLLRNQISDKRSK